ncbi:27160_t:CDS:2 [Dentiscutata erythropus]|uniref:27160_t:CDS:1 n=1 Tax=Dentiscutata erythropus TaxID=1348616 RepID=A0A9N9BKT7_9GLOM|nr:27160_t:CDS:2 [Dentiscutata erythropus]
MVHRTYLIYLCDSIQLLSSLLKTLQITHATLSSNAIPHSTAASQSSLPISSTFFLSLLKILNSMTIDVSNFIFGAIFNQSVPISPLYLKLFCTYKNEFA